MKFCHKCGKELADEVKFCTGCGTKCPRKVTETVQPPVTPEPVPQPIPVPQPEPAPMPQPESIPVPQPEPVAQPIPEPVFQPEAAPQPMEAPVAVAEPEQPKKGKGKLILFISAGVLTVAMVAGGIFLGYYFGAQQKVLRAWDEGNYKQALSIVKENRDLRSDEEFVEVMLQRLDTLKADYTNGSVDFESAQKALEILEDMRLKDVEGELLDASEYIYQIEGSRAVFAQAEGAFEEEEYLYAAELYQQVVENDPNYDDAQERITLCKDSYRQKMLDIAQSYLDDNCYTDAIAVLEEALWSLPEDEELTARLEQYQSQYTDFQKSELLAEAEALAEAEYLLGAVSLLDDYMEINGEDAELLETREKYYGQYIESVLQTAQGQADSGDSPAAIYTIVDALRELPEDETLKEALVAQETAYAKAVVAQSDEYLNQKKYADAMNVIVEGRTVIPDHELLMEQAAKVEELTPNYLLDVSAAYDAVGYEEYVGDANFQLGEENFGNGFTLGANGYACFNISAQYTRLTMTFGHVVISDSTPATVLIYLDGALSQTVPVGADVAPQLLELDITGVRQLRFELECSEEALAATGANPQYGFAEVAVD